MSREFRSEDEKMKFFVSSFEAVGKHLPKKANAELLSFMIWKLVSGYGMSDAWPDMIAIVSLALADDDDDDDEDEDCTCDKCKTKMIEDAMDDADHFLDNVLKSKRGK